MSDAGLASPNAANALEAAPGWQRIDFISDLHLSSATPLTFAAWASYMRDTPADAVFILGDLFEAWVGDDSRFEGFEAECTAALSAATRVRHVGFMLGNRDFLVGAEMLQACGVAALPDPCVLTAFGQRVLLTHGDALCLADTEYQKFRAMVRSPAWQQAVLQQPLPVRRRMASEMRSQSEAQKSGMTSPAAWVDIDIATATGWLHAAGAATLVHGHTHRPGSNAIAPGCLRHVLSDWALDHPPQHAEVLRLTQAGFTRLPLSQATR